ncbi:MAG: hypothetical protein K9K76_06835 [Halanaerobiales bacterium]|nr:hypothetical protein [Halanaerobiales bacterium]
MKKRIPSLFKESEVKNEEISPDKEEELEREEHEKFEERQKKWLIPLRNPISQIFNSVK